MPFSARAQQAALDRMDRSRGRVITMKIGNGTGYDEYASRAVFGKLTERDLVNGSSLQQGDIRLIVSSTHWPVNAPMELERKDQVVFDGRPHSVVHCDPYDRMIGEHRIATELVVRG